MTDEPNKLIPPGKLIPMPEPDTSKMTILELAEYMVERAFIKLECAFVEYQGARQRLAMIRSHTWHVNVRTGEKS